MPHPRVGEALPAMALPVSNTALKARLFLLSSVKASKNNPLEAVVNKCLQTEHD